MGGMAKLSGVTAIGLTAFKSKNIDTICYRGSAPLAHLAVISQADIFDQATNPDGLQRDLSPKHASEAYEYVHRARRADFPRAYPEIVLNVRDRKVVRLQERGGNKSEVQLHFGLKDLKKGRVQVSGMSGNRAALIIAGEMAKELTDEMGENIMKQLESQLTSQD